VVGCCSLQESLELPPLWSWQASWGISTFNNIFVKIHKTKVTIGQLEFLIPSLHAYNVRTWSVKGLDQPRRQKRNEDACPLERV
jgi:hypothetical protein